jgi:hypothetical protein
VPCGPLISRNGLKLPVELKQVESGVVSSGGMCADIERRKLEDGRFFFPIF